LICLINQSSFLLRRQLEKLEQSFLQEGGFTERLYRERKRARESDRSAGADKSDKSDNADQAGGTNGADSSDRSDESDKGRNTNCTP